MAGAADHLLLDTVQRRLRQPAGWVAVVLHLSRLPPPLPRPHHRRIARVLMEDAARRYDGFVFAPVNGDLLLLCRAGEVPKSRHPLRVASPRVLPDILARLLRADLPAPRDVISFWPLETTGETLLTYALDRVATEGGNPAAMAEHRSQPALTNAIEAALDMPEAAGFLHRQTAVLVADEGLRPLFRELRFSVAALEARVTNAGRADTDPFLFCHLAMQLDRRVLGLVGDALAAAPGQAAGADGAPRLHLNLTLASLRTEAFTHLSELMRARGTPLGIEVSVMEACSDPEGFAAAQAALRRLDVDLVLDGVSQRALQIANPAALQPDLVKLVWSPRGAEPDHPSDGPEQRLIHALGPERVVLHHAETEAAMRWGMERGIRRFQGRYVDTMLGALRLSSCSFAPRCTLHQCSERAAATAPDARRDCRNTALLDAGAPARTMLPEHAATARGHA